MSRHVQAWGWGAGAVGDDGYWRGFFAEACPTSVLLRSVATRLYVGAGRGWVADPRRAFNFREVRNAAGWCYRERLSEMEVVFRTETPECELRVPVGEDW